jgi:hypothetical protein
MTEHKNIYAALAAAQAGMGTVVKGAVNPAFKSKYADLADVVAVVVPALSDQGIAMYHAMMRDDHGLIMRTTLAHGLSETFIHCDVPLIVDRNNMQGMKSATTYAKRIGVESLTGIAPEDDDGNAAAKSPPKDDPKPRNVASEQATADAIDYLAGADDLPDLKHRWDNLPNTVRTVPAVIAAKEARKVALSQPKPAADLGGDAIPY